MALTTMKFQACYTTAKFTFHKGTITVQALVLYGSLHSFMNVPAYYSFSHNTQCIQGGIKEGKI